jgi:hypothetical protein
LDASSRAILFNKQGSDSVARVKPRDIGTLEMGSMLGALAG